MTSRRVSSWEATLAPEHADNDYVELLVNAIRRKLLPNAAVIRKAKQFKVRVAEKGTGVQVDLDLSI